MRDLNWLALHRMRVGEGGVTMFDLPTLPTTYWLGMMIAWTAVGAMVAWIMVNEDGHRKGKRKTV